MFIKSVVVYVVAFLCHLLLVRFCTIMCNITKICFCVVVVARLLTHIYLSFFVDAVSGKH